METYIIECSHTDPIITNYCHKKYFFQIQTCLNTVLKKTCIKQKKLILNIFILCPIFWSSLQYFLQSMSYKLQVFTSSSMYSLVVPPLNFYIGSNLQQIDSTRFKQFFLYTILPSMYEHTRSKYCEIDQSIVKKFKVFKIRCFCFN